MGIKKTTTLTYFIIKPILLLPTLHKEHSECWFKTLFVKSQAKAEKNGAEKVQGEKIFAGFTHAIQLALA